MGLEETKEVFYFVLDIPQRKLYAGYLIAMFSFVVAAPLIRTIINTVTGIRIRGDR